MLDRYRKRLKADLDRWIEAGLVPADNRAAILADIAPAPSRWSAQGAAAILGAVLLALAGLSFIAANWADLSRLVRFAIIITALWSSFAGAAIAFARRYDALGHALALLGAALFGGAIVLTAQTFNMSAFRNTGVLIWAIGALATALAIPSRPVLILAAVVGTGWLASETQNPLTPTIVWSYPVLFVVTAIAAWRLQSRVTMNIVALTLIGWLLHALYRLDITYDLDALTIAASLALWTGAIGLGAALLRERGVFGAGVLAGWGAAGGAASAFALQAGLDGDGAAPGLAYAAIAGPALLASLIALVLQARAGPHASAVARVTLGAAAMIAFAMPYIHGMAGEALITGLEFALGAGVFAAAAALILIGAAPGRRTAGVVGVILFTAQAIYVYAELFSGLLGTAAFFFVGGLLMIAVSVLLTRIARRLSQGEMP